MAETTPDSFLGKIPKNNPGWSTGTVVIIVAIGFVLFFFKEELQQVILKGKAAQDQSFQLESTTVSSLLKLIAENQAQITNLSVGSVEASKQILILTNKVSELEKGAIACEAAFKDCETELKKYKRDIGAK